MKVSTLSFLLFAAALSTAAAQSNDEDKAAKEADKKRKGCEDCVEDLDDAKECLRICNNIAYDPDEDLTGTFEDDGSLLNFCLDGDNSKDKIEDLDDLIDCCKMEKDCEKELEEAQECVQECFDPCIGDTAKAYLECIDDENKGVDSNKCSRQTCLDGFLDDLEDDADFSGDVLDLKNVEKRLKKIDQEDLEDCELLSDFVDAVCDIGDDCCEKCNEDLAIVVDCLINDIVIPYVAIELNTTIEVCPIDEDCGITTEKSRKKDRHLAHENELVQKALSLKHKQGGQSKRNLAREAALKNADKKRALQTDVSSDQAVEECQSAMTMNMIAHNITYATSIFMECVTVAAIAVLPATEDDTTTSAAPAAFHVAAYVSIIVGSLFASF